MTPPFADFDFDSFWDQSEWADDTYVGRPLTDEMIREAEATLGYKLPASYIELLKNQNGGTPRRTVYKTTTHLLETADHVSIVGIFGVDEVKDDSLLGGLGDEHWREEWGYPRIGIYFCDTPSGGHDMLCLDYRECGPRGEPRVVHVDQDFDYKITQVAPDFETFIRSLGCV